MAREILLGKTPLWLVDCLSYIACVIKPIALRAYAQDVGYRN